MYIACCVTNSAQSNYYLWEIDTIEVYVQLAHFYQSASDSVCYRMCIQNCDAYVTSGSPRLNQEFAKYVRRVKTAKIFSGVHI